ncbi:ABC transporter permease [Agromyces silvae]|uniref:ABC transporter permease n=1 Tax=Agromyces silvae TaxID=3388266 RepID=UPI00280A6D7B|nr:ABC transporter permease [Agromyces protaetiae]
MITSLSLRVVSSIGVFIAIAVGLFVLVHAAPGDPIEMSIPPELGGADREAYIAARREALGLNDPMIVQFGRWFGGVLTGDLGYSLSTGRPVSQILADRLGPTLLLMGGALLIGTLIAIPAGIVAAVKRNTPADYTISTVSVLAICFPGFFLAMLGIYVFAVQLRLLPSSGMTSSGGGGPGDVLLHLILPVSLLALTVAAPFTRFVRGGMLEELGKDYVRTVVAKGGNRVRVVGHALRNTLLSLVTVLMLYIPVFLAGAVAVEQVFAWPGMGQLSIQAVAARDYPVIIGFGLYVALLVLACNLIADIAYVLLDPRVRSQR